MRASGPRLCEAARECLYTVTRIIEALERLKRVTFPGGRGSFSCTIHAPVVALCCIVHLIV